MQKPLFKFSDGELKLIPPKIGLKAILRDKSYVLAKIFAFFERQKNPLIIESFQYAVRLYSHIVIKETSDLRKKGVRVVIAFHGYNHINGHEKKTVDKLFDGLAEEPGIYCIFLDKVLIGDNKTNLFLSDGHWSEHGHAVVGQYISEYLSTMEDY